MLLLPAVHANTAANLYPARLAGGTWLSQSHIHQAVGRVACKPATDFFKDFPLIVPTSSPSSVATLLRRRAPLVTAANRLRQVARTRFVRSTRIFWAGDSRFLRKLGHRGYGTIGHKGYGITGHKGYGIIGHKGYGIIGHRGYGIIGHRGYAKIKQN